MIIETSNVSMRYVDKYVSTIYFVYYLSYNLNKLS